MSQEEKRREDPHPPLLHHCCGTGGAGRNWSKKSPTARAAIVAQSSVAQTFTTVAVQAVPPAMLMRLEELEEELERLRE